jgi:hypothetical protein
MNRANENLVNRIPRPRATSVAADWGKTFVAQSLIGVLIAVLWTMLGLQ